MIEVQETDAIDASGLQWAPVTWAVDRLRRALEDQPSTGGRQSEMIICRPGSRDWAELVERSAAPSEFPSEAFAIANRAGTQLNGPVLVGAAGSRGLAYALTDLADVLELSDDLGSASASIRTRYEQPRVPLRSVTRLYASHRFDHGWLHDRSFWDDYLSELVTHRFNRFSLAFGLGYDYLIDKRVVDNDMCFLYPFVLDVPGHQVRVSGLDDRQRERNLAALQYAAAAATERGLEFGLGLWNHAPRLEPREPTERWLIEGLSEHDHARYCADALALLLTEIPQVTSLTFRVHFEGGVPEPTHAFWREVMAGVARVERTITVDAHAKGINAELLDALRSAGSPLTLSTKYWGEHMGLPYHQAGIREKEFSGHRRRARSTSESGGGSGADVTRQRSFTRYGYADFARTDAEYRLVHRIWPGTQRVLATPDPVTAAGIGRHATFARSRGVEWFDALTCLGKKDSAENPLPGEPIRGRGLYRDPDLETSETDSWRKYAPVLRVNGRCAYDPDAESDGWDRWFRANFGPAADDIATAAAHAARVLPLITAVHAPSVAGNLYWPEMDSPIPLIEFEPQTENPFADRGWHLDPSFDMEPPYRFGNTSPLDPELFASPDDFADALIAGTPLPRHTPFEVAGWLDELAGLTHHHVRAAREVASGASDIRDRPQLERMAIDAEIAAGLGEFFAAKLRAAVAWGLHGQTGRIDGLSNCLDHYRAARANWAALADVASAYRDDLPFGQMPYQRGHWRDRLPAIDADLAAVSRHQDQCNCRTADLPIQPWQQLTVELTHQPPADVCAGRPVLITATVAEPGIRLALRYREVDQSRRWVELPMSRSGSDRCRWTVEIPGSAISGDFHLQYRFVGHRPADGDQPAAVGLWPGLDPVRLDRQPYHLLVPDRDCE